VMHPAWHLGHSTGAAVFTLIQLYNGALCSRFFSPGCNQLYQEHSSMRQMSSTHIWPISGSILTGSDNTVSPEALTHWAVSAPHNVQIQKRSNVSIISMGTSTVLQP
jgi:hypothetical protein